MWPDQAAGLRAPGRALILLSPRHGASHDGAATRDDAATLDAAATELARVLPGPALIVACRPPVGVVRPLHDWRRNLAHGELPVVQRAGGACLDAPGCRPGDPAVIDAARGWAWLVFDAGWPGALPLAGCTVPVVVEVGDPADAARGYAWCKALLSAGVETRLVGARAESVAAAVVRFLGAEIAWNAHFADLAARMALHENDIPRGPNRRIGR